MRCAAIRLLVSLLVAQLVVHAMACGEGAPTPPDAPIPTCASLGCTTALCASHASTTCTCAGQACTMAPQQ